MTSFLKGQVLVLPILDFVACQDPASDAQSKLEKSTSDTKTERSGRQKALTAQKAQKAAASTTVNVDQKTDSKNPQITELNNQPISDCYKGSDFSCRVESEIVRYTNEKRLGISALIYDAKLGFVARDWSQKQSVARALNHEGFPADRRQVYSDEFNQNPVVSAENVGLVNADESMSAEAVARKFVDLWFASPSHKVNMLGAHKNLGARLYKANGIYYATQIFGD